MIVFTSICANYIPKAAVLAESVKAYNSQAKFFVCLAEREIKDDLRPFLDAFDEVVLAQNIGIPDFDSFIFKYDIVEASTAVKGQFFKHLLEQYPEEQKFVYLDPDTKVFRSLQQLEQLLDEQSIILTPHLTIPEDGDDHSAIWDNEINSALIHGVYNLGFLAISRSSESIAFINWWTDRLRLYCYDDMKDKGIFTDQKWIDLAPGYFDVYILRDPSFNAAPWNLSKRHLSRNDQGEICANGLPLHFYHFSGFDSGANESVTKRYVPDESNVIYEMRNTYIGQCKEKGQEVIGAHKWSYGYYDSGEKVSKLARQIYRSHNYIYYSNNPFQFSNERIESVLPMNSRNRKVLIWGTGSGGVIAKQYYESCNIAISGFIDSNSLKSNEQVEGLPVIGIEDLQDKQKEVYVIIGSSYVEEIMKTLSDIHYVEKDDYIVSATIQYDGHKQGDTLNV